MEILIVFAGLGLIWIWKHLAKDASRAGKNDTAKAKLNPEARNVISFDDRQIRVTYSNGETRSILWTDITMVGIRTTDEGPFLPDVFWGLHGVDKSPEVVYPQGATGDSALLEAMERRLAGFDNRKVIEAMGSADHAFFLVWEKKDDSVRSAA
jgi:hypothetical protein